MANIKRVSLAAMIIMVLISSANIFGARIAGVSVLIGVIFFFIDKKLNKQSYSGSGLDLKTLGQSLKTKNIWIWIALPLVMDALSITLAKLVLPQYIEHVIARTSPFVSFENIVVLLPQLLVLALGEEIAWRAFFQKQLCKLLPLAPTLVISSILFGIGHFVPGSTLVVAYDIFFVFVNSILYGIVFQKTNNAWASTLSHFLANLFSVVILVII